jgi:hypothetical protein
MKYTLWQESMVLLLLKSRILAHGKLILYNPFNCRLFDSDYHCLLAAHAITSMLQTLEKSPKGSRGLFAVMTSTTFENCELSLVASALRQGKGLVGETRG